MAEYSCDICEEVFKQKGKYTAHKNRKRPCKKGIQAECSVQAAKLVISPPSPSNPPAKVDIIKPVLKWVGGKTQILDEVLAFFPKEMNNYHEPFVGGASVLLGLLSHIQSGNIKLSGRVYASDLNANLIALYKNIQSKPSEFIAEIKKLIEEFQGIEGTEVNRKATNIQEAQTSPESYYFWIRSRFNKLSKEDKMTPTASAMIVFMNKTCFRGVYREGPNGFNVPFGNYKHPTIMEEEHIRAVSTLIKDVVFTIASFTESLGHKPISGDFVYLDPPYAPETATSFVSYTADGFHLENHQTLFKTCHDMSTKGIKLLMSNADVSLVKEAFPSPQYTTQTISCRRAIHSKNPESKTNEVLITN